ncbi:MAG: hypothetical protein Q8S09_05710 [Hyphomonas sp.]|nr:hypothetical protein [Hyphomonas sp.]
MRTLKSLGPLLLGAAFLAACGGSAEKEGEKLDTAIEEATGGEADASDGLLEDTGEVIDEITGNENTDPVDAVGDAIEDATDDNPE